MKNHSLFLYLETVIPVMRTTLTIHTLSSTNFVHLSLCLFVYTSLFLYVSLPASAFLPLFHFLCFSFPIFLHLSLSLCICLRLTVFVSLPMCLCLYFCLLISAGLLSFYSLQIPLYLHLAPLTLGNTCHI